MTISPTEGLYFDFIGFTIKSLKITKQERISKFFNLKYKNGIKKKTYLLIGFLHCANQRGINISIFFEGPMTMDKTLIIKP